jgi:hypothetical protein
MSILSSCSMSLCAHSRTDLSDDKFSFSTETWAPVSDLEEDTD